MRNCHKVAYISGETGNGHDDQSLDLRVGKKSQKRNTPGIQRQHRSGGASLTGNNLGEDEGLEVHISVYPAPGLCLLN